MKAGATAGFGEGEREERPGEGRRTEDSVGGRRGAGGRVPRDPEEGFRTLGRWGIKNVGASASIADPDRLYATVDELKSLRDMADNYGIIVDVLNPPFPPSSNIDREKHPAIMLGRSPQRDRDIEQIQTMINNCAAANIPCIKYNPSLLGVVRMGKEPGRGDSTYTYYDWSKRKPTTIW